MKWGVVQCSAGDRQVLRKAVCFNELGAIRRGRDWKRRKPATVVRVFSLLPGDTSSVEVIGLVPRRQRG